MRLIAGWKATLESWLDTERDRLALWLPVFMGAGVLTYYAVSFEPVSWLGSAIALPAIALAFGLPRVRLLIAPIAAAALGFASAQFATAWAPPIETDLPSRATIITGTIRAVETLAGGRRITIQPARLDGAADPLQRSIRVRLQKGDDGSVATGDSVRIRALIRPPASPSYPGGWDLQRDAFYAGLGGSGYALGKAERTVEAIPGAPMRFIQWLRELIGRRIVAAIPGVAGPVSVTMLIGGSVAISAADWTAFRDSGLAHLLAVSGSNMVAVVGCMLLVFRGGFALSERASLFWPTKKLAVLCALPVAGAYMVLCGMQVPIIRSFLMVCLFAVAQLADRRPLSLRGLALAAVMLMLIAPQELPGPSFQMSFSAVLALLAGYEAFRPWLSRLRARSWKHRLAHHLLVLALSSVFAGCAAAPFGAYHFGRMQVYFVLANMVAVPVATLVVPAGLIAMALMPLHLEALALVPMGWAAGAILWIARITAALPAATFAVPHIPAWGLCLFSLGFIWIGLWQTRRRLLGLAVMFAGLASPLLDHPPDLLISSDARLIALRTEQGAFIQQLQGGSKFTRDSWEQYWALGKFQPMPDVLDPVIRCDKEVCLLHPYAGRPGAMLARGARQPGFCGQVSVIVSAEPARGLCPRPWPKLVDRFTVWREGSAAIWLEQDGARIVTDRSERGTRPWVPPPPKPRKQAAPTLPLAAVDRDERREQLPDAPAPEAAGIQ